MNCEPILSSFSVRCEHISEGLAYIESPIASAYDSGLIGAYVQEVSKGRYRLSDNGETMFYAAVHQINPKASKAISTSDKIGLAKMAESGEIFMVCDESELGVSYAHFVEHISRLSVDLDRMRERPKTVFQRFIGRVLTDQFGNNIKQSQSVIGASGHEIAFQFSLKLGEDVKYINTIGAKQGGVNWSSVYSNIGKLMDARSANPNLNKVVILERSTHPQDDEKAIAAIAEVSKVIVFESQAQVCNALAA